MSPSDADPVSPLAPTQFPKMPSIHGVRLATFAAGLRYHKRADLMLAALDEGARVAGVFTRSLCPSAPVDWCRAILARGVARAVVCNAGNANAFTGKAGDTAARLTAETIAESLGIDPHAVFLASTGVIGETLPTEALRDALPKLAGALGAPDHDAWARAADAIRTTDTFAKGATATARLGALDVTVNGIAKGSGMIAPDMATMLGFAFTDAPLPTSTLQTLLLRAVARSFNSITVDSDTSTSDTVLLFATGDADPSRTDPDAPGLADFACALDSVMLDLAHQIVRDGEGATKFVTVSVTGAESNDAARRIALAIGNSPLVKTMLAASDANWGRLVMAVGKAGEKADRDRLNLWIGDEQCAAGGIMKEGYSEARATEHLEGDEVRLRADVGIGAGEATIWTCDLTHRYIDINAGYRS